MTRRLRRLRDFDVTLEIGNDEFIRPPRDSQRNWLLNRVLDELVDQLRTLDRHARKFVRGSDLVATDDRTRAVLGDDEIMEDWQIPLMQALAEAVTPSHGDILEVGFGRGVSSGFIQECGVRSHTIIECNDSVVERFERWRQTYPDRDIRIVHGKWQDTLPDLGKYDGVFFHTYPLNEEEFIEQIAESTTFAQHFFAHAASHLVDGGRFSYLSFEIDSLSRTHQRALFEYFRELNLRVLSRSRRAGRRPRCLVVGFDGRRDGGKVAGRNA